MSDTAATISAVVHYLNERVRLTKRVRYKNFFPVLCGELAPSFAEYLAGVTCTECRIRIAFMETQKWLTLEDLRPRLLSNTLRTPETVERYLDVRKNGLAAPPAHAFNRQQLLEHAKLLEVKIALNALNIDDEQFLPF